MNLEVSQRALDAHTNSKMMITEPLIGLLTLDHAVEGGALEVQGLAGPAHALLACVVQERGRVSVVQERGRVLFKREDARAWRVSTACT